MSTETLTMPSAAMTAEEHVLTGQLSLDELLVQEQETNSMFNNLLHSRAGQFLTKFAVTAAAFAGGGEGLVAATAAADTAPTAPMTSAADLPFTVTASFKTETSNAHVKVSDVATGKVNILANFKANGIPTKQRKQLERQGKCQVFDGTKVVIDTAGHDTNNMTEYGRDYRTSEFCKISGRWIRAKCGNAAFIQQTPPVPVVENAIFVKSFGNEKVKLHAESTAVASCTVDGASASASGKGVASAEADLRSFIKTSHKSNIGSGSVAIKTYERATGRASTNAEASANCASTAATVTIVEQPQPPVVVPPKNGTEGPGAGTPGQPGGPGAGGQPGNTTTGETCRDPADSTDGDMNPSTQGNIMSGTPDQFGYCVGQAQPLVNG
jgi:hypothetical protein